jgi:hypothetical protein
METPAAPDPTPTYKPTRFVHWRMAPPDDDVADVAALLAEATEWLAGTERLDDVRAQRGLDLVHEARGRALAMADEVDSAE